MKRRSRRQRQLRAAASEQRASVTERLAPALALAAPPGTSSSIASFSKAMHETLHLDPPGPSRHLSGTYPRGEAMVPPGSATTEFESLLAEALDPAYRTAYHLTRNREDAEELVQEAALLAFRGFDRFEPGTNFRAWFMTILRNRFISTYRKRKREVPTVDLEDAGDLYLYSKLQPSGTIEEVSAPAKRLIARLDAEQVSAALASLPDEFRDVATLYFTQDLSYQEIAGVLDIPVGTVRSRLHRARRLLQRQLWHLGQEYGIVPQHTEPEDAS